MATTLNTRIAMRYDTFSNWEMANPVLLKGEIAVVEVSVKSDDAVSPPVTLFKVGDGKTAFKTLPYLNAPAADVYEWAKQPALLAENVEGLSDFISGEISDSNTTYKAELEGDVLKLSAHNIDDVADKWTLVSEIDLKNATSIDGALDDISDLKAEIVKKIDDQEMSLAISAAITGLDIGTYVKKTDLNEYAKTEDLSDYVSMEEYEQSVSDHNAEHEVLNGTVNGISSKVDVLVGTDTNKSVRRIANEELVAQLIPETAKEAMNTLSEIANWIQNHPEDAAALNDAIVELKKSAYGENGTANNPSGGFAKSIAAVSNKLDGIEDGATVVSVMSQAIADATKDMATDGELSEVMDIAESAQVTAGNATTSINKLNEELYGKDGTAAVPTAGIAANLKTLEEGFVKLKTDVTGENGLQKDFEDLSDRVDDLHPIASTGDAAALVQNTGDYLILNCGTAAAYASETTSASNLPS